MTEITVHIDGSPSPVFVHLNINENLSNIRVELKKNDEIRMDDSFSFAKKEINGVIEIGVDEKRINLDNILDGNNLHLVKSNWKFLNDKFELESGIFITPDGIEREKAFTMKYCKMTEISGKGCNIRKIECDSNEYWGMRSDLFFTGNVNVKNLMNLGLTFTNSTYSYKEFAKVSFNFSEYLEATSDFIEAVENAVESKDLSKFKQITEKFGQFIPKEVILGGRVYFKSIQTSHKCTKLIGGEKSISRENFDKTAEINWIESLKDFKNWECIEFKNPDSIFQLLSNDLREKIFSLIGRKIHYSKIENHTYRLENFGRPIVFKLNIPLKFSKFADYHIFATVVDTEENDDFFNYQILRQPNADPSLIIHCIQNRFRKRECKLRIGWMIIGYHTDFDSILTDSNIQLKVLSDKDPSDTSDTSDTSKQSAIYYKKKFLNFEYNSLTPCLGIPVLSNLDASNEYIVIGHHFYKEKNKIGSYTFSYCFKHNHYVDLPDFTFYSLIISKYPHSNDYGISPFSKDNITKNITKNIKKIGHFFEPKSDKSDSSKQMKIKYISLHSSGDSNCGPIFLKQNFEKIEKIYTIKSMNHNGCKRRDSCICKNQKLMESEENLKYAFFTQSEEQTKNYKNYDTTKAN